MAVKKAVVSKLAQKNRADKRQKDRKDNMVDVTTVGDKGKVTDNYKLNMETGNRVKKVDSKPSPSAPQSKTDKKIIKKLKPVGKKKGN